MFIWLKIGEVGSEVAMEWEEDRGVDGTGWVICFLEVQGEGLDFFEGSDADRVVLFWGGLREDTDLVE